MKRRITQPSTPKAIRSTMLPPSSEAAIKLALENEYANRRWYEGATGQPLPEDKVKDTIPAPPPDGCE